ncbi:glycosyltransferase [Pseudonocardiaceae bacterium YIM PH 21723]|nr:glycosyltransferase [Pseudonocardiaceae bacterium YIM PH 21723]
MNASSEIRFLLPGDIDDPAAPSGGNAYDRRIIDELVALGIRIEEVPVLGTWPQPDARARAQLADTLAGCPDGAVLLLDGLLACGVPDLITPHAGRLRLAVLVHLPLAAETGADPALNGLEREVLHAADAVIATSPAAARDLRARHGLDRVHVAVPGVDPAPLSPGTDGVSNLLCVASLTPRKGHDLLVRALDGIEHPWTCTFAGPGTLNVRSDRISTPGPLHGADLERAYSQADLFLLASRAETYGMVITEAVARGIPVLASSVPDALGDGGLLLPADDLDAWRTALRRWFAEPGFRADLRDRAVTRRADLPRWHDSAQTIVDIVVSLFG